MEHRYLPTRMRPFRTDSRKTPGRSSGAVLAHSTGCLSRRLPGGDIPACGLRRTEDHLPRRDTPTKEPRVRVTVPAALTSTPPTTSCTTSTTPQMRQTTGPAILPISTATRPRTWIYGSRMPPKGAATKVPSRHSLGKPCPSYARSAGQRPGTSSRGPSNTTLATRRTAPIARSSAAIAGRTKWMHGSVHNKLHLTRSKTDARTAEKSSY